MPFAGSTCTGVDSRIDDRNCVFVSHERYKRVVRVF